MTEPTVPPAGNHGGDGAAIAHALGIDPADLLDLSQTLNPFAPPVETLAARHLASLRSYPDSNNAEAMLAEVVGVDRDRLRLTSGGASAIALVAASIGGRVSEEPDFSLYPRNPTGPVWRSDPHSPSGHLAASTDIAAVWDEAFYPLATGRWSGHRDGITIGSLTKTLACPGLRIGYVIADEVDELVAEQPHWPVGSLALALLPELLESVDLADWKNQIADMRQQLADLLQAHGWVVHQGDAPWVLVERAGLRDQLAPFGIVVRDCSSFGLEGTCRVAVPSEAGLDALARALNRMANQ
jgi:histidinol-phosphate/aromatic aminotransferase/cobyric acid decarboxylase-like protein